MATDPNEVPEDDEPAMPGPEEYAVIEVDGFALLTPEQKTWPVVSLRPKPKPPVTAPGTPPSPPG